MENKAGIVGSGTGRKRGRPKLVRTIEDGISNEEEAAESKATGSAASLSTESSLLSPRRSSRGVVPNRRFQDMDLDYWKKKGKDESDDEPLDKKAKGVKRGRSCKETKTGLSTETSYMAIKETSPKAQTPVISVRVSTPLLSPPHSVAKTMTINCQPESALSSLSSSVHPGTKTSTPAQSSPAPSSLQQALTSSVGSLKLAAQSRPPASSRIVSIISSRAHPLSVSIPRPTSTSKQPSDPSKSNAKTVEISLSEDEVSENQVMDSDCGGGLVNSSNQQNVQEGLMKEDMGGTADDDSSPIVVYEADVEEMVSAVLEGQPSVHSGEEHQDALSEVTESVGERGLTLVTASDLPEMLGLEGAPLVHLASCNSTFSSTETGEQHTDIHGKVVGKQMVTVLPVPRSVYVVRRSSAWEAARSTESGQNTLTLGAKVVTSSSVREPPELSIVEVTPSMKDPMVRDQSPPVLSGKVIKVLTTQPVRPDKLQDLVTSHISELTSRRGGPTKQGKSPKSMTVEVSMSVLQSKKRVPSIMPENAGTQCVKNKEIEVSTAGEDTLSTSQQSEAVLQHNAESAAVPNPTTATADLPALLSSSTSSMDVHAEEDDASHSVAESTSSQDHDLSVSESGSLDSVQKECSTEKAALTEELVEDRDDDEELQIDEKFSTSGTQTPYARDRTRKVITVHVHPPERKGEQNKEVITVTKVKEESLDDLDLIKVEKEAQLHQEWQEAKKCKYVIVQLPEGATVTQPIRRAEVNRIDEDPSFYTMDEHGNYVCDMCGYSTTRRSLFYKHKRKHMDASSRPFACTMCKYRAATSSNLKRHQEIHQDIRNHNCHICHLNFRQKIHLERHIKYRHEEKKVKCPLCDYVCANENPDLKVHIKRRHVVSLGPDEAANAYKCPQCGIIASSKRDLKQHLKFHLKGPELKLFCNMCSFVTDCESRLRRHQYIHTKEKPYQCGLCNYRGSQKEHVLRHMRTQHQIEISRRPRTTKRLLLDRSTVDDVDSAKNAEKADYTSEEKIFACNHCTMKFSKLINLYKHLHTQHRDIMPNEEGDFSCVVCDFHTTNKKNLLVHMRRHNINDQSPPTHVYSCVLCRYMNPKRRNLFQHMRKKHQIEIVLREDGSTSCFVGNEVNSAVAVAASSTSLSPTVVSNSSDTMVNILPVNMSDLISSGSQSAELQAATIDGHTIIRGSSSLLPAIFKVEDLALVVSNPNSISRSGLPSASSSSSLLATGSLDGVESLTIGPLSGDDAAEAVQGLQALAQRSMTDCVSIIEEQVQVMDTDDQTTLIIEQGINVEQLIPKTEPIDIVEMDSAQLLSHNASTISDTTLAEGDFVVEASTASSTMSTVGEGLQLSAEQLMNLSTGDYLEINGDLYKVEVSSASNPDGTQGPQVISFEPASSPPPQMVVVSGSLDTEQSEFVEQLIIPDDPSESAEPS